MSRKQASQEANYEICVEGKLDAEWAGWFDGWTVRGQDNGSLLPVTILTGRVVDQAGLRGVLNKLWDLNLALVSVQRLEKGQTLAVKAKGASRLQKSYSEG